LGQAFDEHMSVINELFDQTAQIPLMGAYSGRGVQEAIETNLAGDKVGISVKVPLVENSEEIKAHINAARKSLKVVVPQKQQVTKVVIDTQGDQTSIKKVTKELKKQSHESKNLQSFQVSSRKQVLYKTLPFAVDLTNRSVEYKDDQLIITVRKAQEQVVKKAQPRIIPVTNK